MKPIKFFAIPVVLLFVLAFVGDAFCRTDEPEDKTLSPYFFVKSDEGDTDSLPLKKTSTKVNIAGVISDVLVTQVYKNEGNSPIEAVYIFPASTRAAVYGMKMTIGKRVIEARIRKKEDARKEYNQAREQGRSASLLEQQRPNVFQMNVANIMPGDEIKVELKYTELILAEGGTYEFVYPTVVGPRYSNRPESTATESQKWVQNPYLHQGQAPACSFDMHVSINAGMPIKDITCLSHKVDVSYSGPSMAEITLLPGDKNGGNRDYILRYRLNGNKIQTGLLLSEGGKEKFFLLMMQPPKRVKTADIPGREYIFIVDVSGSMNGFPLDISKNLMKELIGNLRTSDRFNVVLFAGDSALLTEESLSATPENIARAINFINREQGGGGTELLPALKRALALERNKGFSRTIVIATDGYVDVEEETFDLIQNNLGNANMFAFGIGTSVNRHLIEGMAHVGMGEPFIITNPGNAQSEADKFRSMIQSPVLTRVGVDFKGFDVYDVQPVSVPDILAERPVIVFGKWRGSSKGTITLSGISGDGKHEQTIDVAGSKPSNENGSLRYLWARHRITILSDYNMLRTNDKRIKEVTDLGLNYNLLTNYTSFVAIDTEVRNKGGKQTTVKQPLPLPEGVSDYAVGGFAKCSRMAPSPALSSLQAQAEMETSDSLSYAPEQEVEKKDKGVTGRNLAIKSIKVSGNLLHKDVEKAVQSSLQKLAVCLRSNDFSGSIVFSMTINADGTVKALRLHKGNITNNTAKACAIKQMKSWQITRTRDGKEAAVLITLAF